MLTESKATVFWMVYIMQHRGNFDSWDFGNPTIVADTSVEL